ncbi:MAG TPA: sulfurtransferase TusA family protein [Thermoanaerobaculaceae bacterium]|nr:sulfurtransferase TusA family protein [Thermoanaerobaculaceae bacterium]
MTRRKTAPGQAPAPAGGAAPAPDLAVGDRFVRAVAELDFAGLASCFAAEARLRALVPRGFQEASGVEDVVRCFQGWFGSAERAELLGREVEAIAGRAHLAWRLRVHDARGPRVIEQQAYATILGGSIAELDLLCSGFQYERQTVEPTGVATRSQEFEVAASVDGGDAGCATLTPLVKATLRDLASGQVLEIVSSEPSAAQDLASWSALTGNPVIAARSDGESNRFYVRKK